MGEGKLWGTISLASAVLAKANRQNTEFAVPENSGHTWKNRAVVLRVPF